MNNIKVVAKLGIVILCLVWSALYSMNFAINLPTNHLDGAFQTASSLFRLNAGQFPGKDFFPYLGIGPIAILFPIFKLFGANLSASVISAQCATLMTGVLSTSLLLHLVWRPRSISISLAAGAILFIAPIEVATYFSFQLPDWLGFSVTYGNSLRPIRSLAPYLLVAGYYFFILKIKNEKFKFALGGILNALILLWSNDYAIPSAGLFIFLVGFHSLQNKTFSLKNSVIFFISLVGSFAALFSLVTHGHPLALIKYNFLDVAKDQWWYFSPYSESARIFNFLQVGKLFSEDNQFPLFVLTLMCIWAILTNCLELALVAWIGLALFAAGSVASVGGHLGGYFGAFYYWGSITLIVVTARFAWLCANRLFQSKLSPIIGSQILLMTFLIGSLLTVANRLITFQSNISAAQNDHARFYVPELGGYLNQEWSGYIGLIRKSDSNQIIEEYWGLWSATKKIISVWPIDSVISALGSTRETAASQLKDAKIIISTRYAMSPEWQPWSLSQNYWFYGELIRNWTPYDLSPTTVLWKKNNHSIKQSKTTNCNIDQRLKIITLDAPIVGFYEVEMKYSLTGDGRHLLMAMNNISFGDDADGFVSLNPKGRVATFPVYISKLGLNPLEIRVTGMSDFSLELLKCDAHQLSLSENEALHNSANSNEDFFITDNNWLHGIARNWAGFFVPATGKTYRSYKSGRLVRFPDGNVRSIIRIERSGDYLNVYLEGEPLMFDKVGRPDKFVVTDQ